MDGALIAAAAAKHVTREETVAAQHVMRREQFAEHRQHQQIGDDDRVNASRAQSARHPHDHDQREARGRQRHPVDVAGVFVGPAGQVSRQHERQEQRQPHRMCHVQLPAAFSDRAPHQYAHRGRSAHQRHDDQRPPAEQKQPRRQRKDRAQKVHRIEFLNAHPAVRGGQ